MEAKHFNAPEGAFADFVMMPGDPLRARYIAEEFLDDAREVTNVRNMLGYTGTHQGRAVSVVGSGMGIPSASIYATELIQCYGVKEILRIGSCGALAADANLRDVVIGMGACTDSNVNRMRFKGYDFSAIADYSMLARAVAAAGALGLKTKVGNIFSADLFYTPDPEMFDVMEKYGVLGVEMEAAGLYGVAAEFGARALAVVTVSDHIRTGAALSADERQSSLDDMIRLALQMRLIDDA
ncbi:MAG: purine-nucleoside phosphorylase [Gammaproteobacteria bacterium]